MQLLELNNKYQQKILSYHGIDFETPSPSSKQLKIIGFDRYNYLVDINSIFSTAPDGNIIDRTSTIKMPFNMYINRPWKNSSGYYSLDECFKTRVNKLEKTHKKINVLWSGGIDSTAVVIGFLKHSESIDNIRILYSTFSIKENPNFYLLLENLKGVEKIDISGDFYINQTLDGIFISGDGADDLTASLDNSFYDAVGYQALFNPWKDYFYKKIQDTKFIDFCEEFFTLTDKNFTTLLEARWWFYTNCKIQKFPAVGSGLLNDNQPLLVGFFDSYEFEHFMLHNIDNIIDSKGYQTYKQQLKNYIFEYDKNKRYQIQKRKENSDQIVYYKLKKQSLQNLSYIMLLSNGTRIRTDNLPLLSEYEYRKKYGNSLDYLFNKP